MTRLTWGILPAVLLLLFPCDAETAEPFPYELATGQEAVLAVTGGGLLGLSAILDSRVEPLTPAVIAALDEKSDWWFDRSARQRWSPAADCLSDYLMYATAASPLFLVATEPGGREPWTLLVMYGEAQLINNGLTYLLKTLVARPRPFVTSGDPRIPLELKLEKEALRSFPSGHTSNAFTAAVYLGSVFERLEPDSAARGWVWGGALTAASLTGILRYLAGRHYPTDILAGALLGVTVGYLVPQIHRRDSLTEPSATPPGLRLVWGMGF